MPWPNDSFARAVIKAVHIARNTPPYRHVVTMLCPCISAGLRIPCNLCNRHFRSQTCFDNHKKKTQGNRKSACELRKCCGTCDAMITRNTHECKKRFCTTCKENKRQGIFALCVHW